MPCRNGVPTGDLEAAMGLAQNCLAGRGPLKRQAGMQAETPLPLTAAGADEARGGPGDELGRDAVLHSPIVPGQTTFASAARTRSSRSGDRVRRSSTIPSSRRAAAR